MRARAALVLLLACALAACTGGLGSAKSAYRKGRLDEAKTELVALEAESKAWAPSRRVEYALYRGLVHLALGDRGAAGVWLREAKAAEDAHPGTLEEDDKARLRLALESEGGAAPPP